MHSIKSNGFNQAFNCFWISMHDHFIFTTEMNLVVGNSLNDFVCLHRLDWCVYALWPVQSIDFCLATISNGRRDELQKQSNSMATSTTTVDKSTIKWRKCGPLIGLMTLISFHFILFMSNILICFHSNACMGWSYRHYVDGWNERASIVQKPLMSFPLWLLSFVELTTAGQVTGRVFFFSSFSFFPTVEFSSGNSV